MSGNSNRAPAVVRAAAVLKYLSSNPHPQTLTQISQGVNIPKSTAVTLCSALADAELLYRDSRGAYQLGAQTVNLGAAYIRQFNMVKEFYRWCQGSRFLRDYLLQIAVLRDRNAFYLGRYEGRNPLWLSANVGDEFPASITAVGNALLCELSNSQIRKLYRNPDHLELWTPQSPSSVAELLERIELARKEGFARDDRGTNLGVYGIAVLVRNESTQGRNYAVGISIPASEASEENIQVLSRELRLMRDHLQIPNQMGSKILELQAAEK